jgi:5-methylthioadenosine/S-adenosylhomocysteine deaminase
MKGAERTVEKRQKQPAIQPNIVIEGGLLLTMKDDEEPIDEATLLIQDDRIAGIHGPGHEADSFPGAEIIDAKNGIIMPGLVNAHGHTAMTLFRGLADDLPLQSWLFDKIFPAEARHLDPETVYWGALLGCLEMIASGTTTVSDGYFFQDATVRAVARAGLRARVAQGVIDFPAPGVSDPKENLKVGRAFLDRWIGFSDLIAPGLFCHSPLTCSEQTLKGAKTISDEYELPLQIHLAETSAEVEQMVANTGHRPVPYLERLRLLNDRLIAVHAVHLNREEMELLTQKDVRVVHVPESNMKLSSGVAAVAEMAAMGLVVGLGTDGAASNNDLDLFQEMDSAAKLAKISTLDPVSLDALSVLKMATSWGAAALGYEKEIGTLEVGKKADVIVVDARSPHMIPLYNPISSLVYSANGADVKDVIVNGRILMKDRSIQTLDAEEIMGKVNAISREIAR